MNLSSNSNRKFSCVNCALQSTCIPIHLDHSRLEDFENIIKRSRILNKGDNLHVEGDPVKYLYILRSGAVKEYLNSKDGDEQIINFFLSGEMIGLDSMNASHYRCSAVALETTTYCALPLNKFEKLCEQNLSLQRQLYRTMSKVISFEEKMLLSSCNKKSHGRVATFLMSLSKRYVRLGYSANEIHLPMSRQEIARYLGLSSETVSRVFTQLQNDKIISVQIKSITINDMPTLRDLAEECHIHKLIEHDLAI